MTMHKQRYASSLRGKLLYLSVTLLAMSAGYASRAYGEVLPAFLREHAGDALWAAMIYFGIRLIFTSWRKGWSAFAGLLFSWFIECSQLIQVPWLNEIRSTTLGALVLGRGFLVMDLMRYAVGILGAWFVDRYVLKAETER